MKRLGWLCAVLVLLIGVDARADSAADIIDQSGVDPTAVSVHVQKDDVARARLVDDTLYKRRQAQIDRTRDGHPVERLAAAAARVWG